ncbi:MAG: TonB-dependent receptor [Cytophagales bacterium]|nr:TonB-dependent receptor [Bernardetiaceae bacterium]MDW8211600.1 TonB-dependent receptor [Cytophagales bacterium]
MQRLFTLVCALVWMQISIAQPPVQQEMREKIQTLPPSQQEQVRQWLSSQKGTLTPEQRQQLQEWIQAAEKTTTQKGNGKITGTVVDASSKEPVEFATVALLHPDTGKPIDGTITNEKGQFTLTKIAAGNYKVAVSFVGYQTVTVLASLANDRATVHLGTIALPTEVKQLAEVEIVEQKDLVEDKIDRITYNAEKDATNAGADATEVLRKVPLLSVDLDGNVQLRGSSNVQVLINNKPSTIIAPTVADALRQIPAEMIKSVEVITSPSARYDAEGTSGIINIITKKNTIQGLNGNINASAGTRSSNLDGGLNFRTGKLGLSLNGGGRAIYVWNDGYNNRTNFLPLGQTTFVNRSDDGFGVRFFSRLQLNADYEISPKSNLSTGVRIGRRGFWDDQNQLTTLGQNNIPARQFTRQVNSAEVRDNYTFNIDYVRTFQKPQQELALLALYTFSGGVDRYSLDQFNQLNLIDYREKNNNRNTNRETTFQADYTHPFTQQSLLETGAKAILRKVTSNNDFATFNFEQNQFVIHPLRNNALNYDQNVVAAYVSYGYTTKFKLGIKAGLRYEYTDIIGVLPLENKQFTQSFGNLIPSIALSQTLKKGNSIKFSYSRRIQRPGIGVLNPFVNLSDPNNIRFGNPELLPELTHNTELTYSAFVNRSSFTISAFWRQTDNAISTVVTVNESGISSTTFDNVAQNGAWGISAFGSMQITKHWRISGNFNAFYATFRSPAMGWSNSGWQYSANFNTQYNFGKGWSVQGFGFVNSPTVQLQGTQGVFSFYSFGLRKEILNKRGGITFGADNFLQRALRIQSQFSGQVFQQDILRNIYNRAVRVTFNYNFGKMNFGQQPPATKRNKKTINNDDVKQEEQTDRQ